MFKLGLPQVKLGAHAEDRLTERTNLDPSIIKSLRKDIQKAPIPYGSHHVELEDGSFAVLKDVSRKGKKRHVVATVLGPDMKPPGVNIARSMKQSTGNKDVYLGEASGPNMDHKEGSQHLTSNKGRSGKFGLSRRERIKNRLNKMQEKGEYSHRRLPNGFQSSQSYSYSSSTR